MASTTIAGSVGVSGSAKSPSNAPPSAQQIVMKVLTGRGRQRVRVADLAA